MRLFYGVLAIALAAVVVGVSAPAHAQGPVQLEGVVLSNDRNPIPNATVDIYRTDIKGSYQTKTDKNGSFTYPVPYNGVFIIVASAPKFAPQFQPNIRPSIQQKKVEFFLAPGDGIRPSLDDVLRSMKKSGEDDEEARKREEEYQKALAEKGKFDARKGHFDTGVQAMQGKDYPTAVSEFTMAIDGLENVDPEYWGELIGNAGGNLAETHYRLAVDLYNNKQKDEAKDHLMLGAKAVAKAIQYQPSNNILYAIQGKTLLLLVDKYGMTDDAETGAAAFAKAADTETVDQKKKVTYLVNAADVYRAAYMTDQAIAGYKKALAADPDNLSAYYGIGLAAMGTSESEEAKRKAIWQIAADYLKAFLDKAPSTDPRAGEVKGLLGSLEKDFKIKPRPIK